MEPGTDGVYKCESVPYCFSVSLTMKPHRKGEAFPVNSNFGRNKYFIKNIKNYTVVKYYYLWSYAQLLRFSAVSYTHLDVYKRQVHAAVPADCKHFLNK